MKIKNLIYLLLPWIWFSCSNEDAPLSVASDDPSLYLELLTRANDSNVQTNEQSVKRLRLLVYDAVGNLEANLLFEGASLTNGLEAGNYTIQSDIRLSSGKKTFCLVGNETSQQRIKLQNREWVGTLSRLKTKDLNWNTRQEAPLSDDGMPFTCMLEQSVNHLGPNHISFSLRRAVGRVDLRLWKMAGLTETIMLTSIEVLNEASQSSLLEGQPLDKTAAGIVSNRNYSMNYTLTEIPGNEADQNSPSSILRSYYLFEYQPNSGEEPSSLRLTFSNGKVAKINLAGDKDPVSGDYIYCIRRNTITNLKLTFNRDKMQIGWTVTDWKGNIKYNHVLGDGS